MNRIVVGVNQVMQHSGMLPVARVDRLEQVDRTALRLEALGAFADVAENRQTENNVVSSSGYFAWVVAICSR